MELDCCEPDEALRKDGITATDTEVAEEDVLQLPQYREFAQPLRHYTCFEQIAEGMETCASFVQPQQLFYKREAESYGLLNIYALLEPMNWYDLPVFECNSTSPCRSRRCSQRVAQWNPVPELKVCASHDKGKGLFTSETLRPGRFIAKYTGEIISREEAIRRRKAQDQSERRTYLLTVCERSMSRDYKCEINIDARRTGNCSRYINHSCEPNLVPVCVRSETSLPSVCFFAVKEIPKTTELTFDYAHAATGTSQECVQLSFTKCYCGSNECRGYLPKN
eukprot:gb/GECG01009830.1/.p1 GENE.gb/GECG01009830.1/~~gb/GECG01009830.1/.p1  ORF type:complete len:279 (+),score=24.64 gb/GECG01009830.1/:1-837(+)